MAAMKELIKEYLEIKGALSWEEICRGLQYIYRGDIDRPTIEKELGSLVRSGDLKRISSDNGRGNYMTPKYALSSAKMSDVEREARKRMGMEENENTTATSKKFREVSQSIQAAGQNESEGDDDAEAIEGDTTGPVMPTPGKKSDGEIKKNPAEYILK